MANPDFLVSYVSWSLRFAQEKLIKLSDGGDDGLLKSIAKTQRADMLMGDSLAGSAVQPVECDLYVMGSLQDEIWPAESSMKCALKLVELHRVLMVCYWSWVLASTLAYRSFECTWEVLKQRVAAHACLFVCLDVDAMTRTWHPCMTPVCSMIGTAIIVSHRMMTCLRPGRATAKVWWSQSTSKDGNLF